MNETLNTIMTRRSVRKFVEGKEIEEEKLDKIISAGLSAPNSGNIQAWRIIVVKNAELKQSLMEAAMYQKFISQVPVVIVICADKKAALDTYSYRGANLYVIQDTAAMTQNILLAAHSMGLGACWVGAFDDREVHELLELPKEIMPVALIPIGYYDASPREKLRTREVITYIN